MVRLRDIISVEWIGLRFPKIRRCCCDFPAHRRRDFPAAVHRVVVVVGRVRDMERERER
ncbi:hypothetical protein MTR_6g042720 [Medicago truncatula]|uniref:Uncharacterized protein n=1 Tax=Medicago truncatula TaxID=3880 RepID=G7KIX1_MEDTR|nr:hypothetical protein MTR_6g042720 [Medicago truncatula]